MNARKELVDDLQKTKEIILPLNLNTKTKEEQISLLDKDINNIQHLELIIPIIGGFSVGKSTFINHYLGQEKLLPTGTLPVTKLATELRYTSGEEYAELIKVDEQDIDKITEIKRIKLSELSSFVAESGNKEEDLDYNYIKLYINNTKLKELEPFIIADMPGLNSGNKLHNLAIEFYLRRGVHFIFLENAESGEINNDSLKELENILNSNKDFSFCLTRCDRTDNETLQEVIDKMVDTLDVQLGEDYKIYRSNLEEEPVLGSIIRDIDQDKIINDIFLDEIDSKICKIIEILKDNVQVLKNDSDNIKLSQEYLLKQKERLKTQQNRELAELENKKFDGVNQILEQVKAELRLNKSRLISRMEGDPKQFSEEIGSLVQSKLSSSIKSYLENVSSELTERFSNILHDIADKNTDRIGLANETLERLKNDINRNLNKTLLDIRNIDSDINDTGSDNNMLGSILKMVISFLTDNPIIKSVVSLLPDFISNIFSSSSHSSSDRHIQEMKRQDMLDKIFNENIVPKVIGDINAKLPEILNDFKLKLMSQIKEIFEKELQQKAEEIDRAVKEKGNVKNKENEISLLSQAIDSLQALIK
nr:dynamin family protein [uncultured Haemophilus sp.]